MGWNSWQLTHQPSSSSINTHSGLPVQRLDLKDEKRQNLQSWSLSWTGMGEYTVRVAGGGEMLAGWQGGGWVKVLGLEKVHPQRRDVLCCYSWGAWEAWEEITEGELREWQWDAWAPRISTLDCTAQGSPWGPGGPCQFLVKSSCHLRPWPQDLGALWLSLPSAQSQAVPLRGFSPHFIRRVTQTQVHMI